jgi:hypothetical protein
MKILSIISAVLLLIGGLNWGLVGLFEFNLVDVIFGHASVISRAIYVLVGVSALYRIFLCSSCCKPSSCCKSDDDTNNSSSCCKK